jgi:hypothetical protein
MSERKVTSKVIDITPDWRDVMADFGRNIKAGELTDESLREWFVRMRIWERRCGVGRDAFFNKPLFDVLRAFIGIKTDAPKVSRIAWIKSLCEASVAEAEAEFEGEMEGAAEEAEEATA